MWQLKGDFCEIYGDKIKKDLDLIEKKRDYIIHRIIKKLISKEEIEKCFEKFFIKVDPSFKRFGEFTSEITLIRNKEMIEEVKSLLK